jgi:hypothetical protein
MHYLSCLHPARPAARRPLAAACLALYLLAWVGFPLPAPTPLPNSADGSHERFPCQHHSCGCNTAEQCWINCCCLSPGQRLAWAKANGIEPPAWIARRLQEVLLQEQTASASTPQGCCTEKSAQTATACCSAACCQNDSHDAPSHDVQDQAPNEASGGTGWVSLLEAQRCRGASSEWLASGAVLIFTTHCQVEPDRSSTFLLPWPGPHFELPTQEPAVPPPRMNVV